ncbi:MAG: hypothetical protein QOG41_214, partial [Thermoleophilaceae bacterium]|nr:hypothetical protein [Thermoleophilaceae bacterium]
MAATPATGTATATSRRPTAARIALAGLCVVYVLLAVLPAARGSNLVLAT